MLPTKPIVDLDRFHLAILDANAARHRLQEKTEIIFGVVNSTGAVQRARFGQLRGRMVEKAQLCALVYLYADVNGQTKLAFNSHNTGFTEQQWLDQELLGRVRARSAGILLGRMPLGVECYLLAKNYEQARPFKQDAELWLHGFYSQLATGLNREIDRRAAAEQVARIARSLGASEILAGLPVEFQQQIEGV